MLIDTHCHLDYSYYEDIDLVISENKKNSISKMIVSSSSRKDIDEVIAFTFKYDIVYCTIGYHPSEADLITSLDIDYLKKKLFSPKVLGIGEIGLDYHYGKLNRDKQIYLFKEQLRLAEQFNLPVVIHSRDATADTIEILKMFKVTGIIHCFSGSLETANIYIKMGFYLGIGGVLTFKNSKLRDVVASVSLENIVLETDSPYLAPDPYRGKINSSKYLKVIANYIANLKDICYEDVCSITSSNVKSIFDFGEE